MIFSVCFLALFNNPRSVGKAMSAGEQLASNKYLDRINLTFSEGRQKAKGKGQKKYN